MVNSKTEKKYISCGSDKWQHLKKISLDIEKEYKKKFFCYMELNLAGLRIQVYYDGV